MKPKKQFRWALWWGLGITLVSIALMFIPGADGDNNSPVSEMLLQMLEMGAVVLIVVIGIVMPALEEFSFRMWGCGKTWAGITSSAMMALFISLTLSWVAGVVSLAIGLAITLMVKDGRKRLLFMMLFSSVLFMLAHTENYDGGVIFIAIALVEKFGFGLLASYLVINHNIFWSMAFHMLNNTIACLAMIMGAANIEPTTFEQEGVFRLDLKPMVFDHSFTAEPTFSDNGDTVTMKNTLGNFIVALLNEEEHQKIDNWAFIYEQPHNRARYDIQLAYNPEAAQSYLAVAHELERAEWLRLDTLENRILMITVVDESKRIEAPSYGPTSWHGAVSLRQAGFAIIEPDDFDYREWNVTIDKEYPSLTDIQEMLQRAGLGLESTDETMTMVRVSVLHNPLEDF